MAMKKPMQSFRCHVCGKLREDDNNRWLMLQQVQDTRPEGVIRYIIVAEWSDEDASRIEWVYACGQEHAQELVKRWLTNGNFKTK